MDRNNEFAEDNDNAEQEYSNSSKNSSNESVSDFDGDGDSEYSQSEGEQELSEVDRRLFDAIKDDDPAAVEEAIENGADVNCRGSRDRTPLMEASMYGSEHVVRLLLDVGADARLLDWDDVSAVGYACKSEHLTVVQMLLDHDNRLLEIADGARWTPLIDACCCGQEAVFRFLLERGANVHTTDSGHKTALHYAAQHGHVEIIRLILDAGANVEARDTLQRTALHYAAIYDRLETMRTLLDAGANVDAVDNRGGTPLMVACRGKQKAVVRFLLERGANVHATDSKQKTGLHYAVEYSGVETIRALLDAGANFEARDNSQRTALHYAAICDRLETMHALLDAGANVEAHAEEHQTALHLAARYCRVEIMRALMNAGANVDAANNRGMTALHYTARHGSADIVRAFIFNHNGNLFAVDRDGSTPFDMAAAASRYTFVLRVLEIYQEKLTQDHGSSALHVLLRTARYSFGLQPVRLPLGVLTLSHFCCLLWLFGIEILRSRDNDGKLPIHIACRTSAPVDVLEDFVRSDPATLRLVDGAGALPLHEYCRGTVNDAAFRFLVDQGGVGTLAVSSHRGELPLHVLCGSINPPLEAVQYSIQSFPGSVTMPTNAGDYPFVIAASSSASLSVIYEIVRANPGKTAESG